MIYQFKGGGHNVVIRNGKKEVLEVQRNVPYQFAITLSYNDVVDMFFALPVERI